MSDKVVCHTPTPGKLPTSIPTWKYALLRAAILETVPTSAPGMAAKDLPDVIRGKLPADKLKELGSVAWHTTTVRLNMEVDGELERIPGSKPMHLVRSG